MKFKQALNTKISFFIIIGLMIGCGQTQNYVHVKNNLYVLPAVKDNSKESALESLLIGNKKGKPLIVFLTGSGNYPLVVHASDSNYYYLFDPGIVADTLKYNYLFVSNPIFRQF
ncbi:hypothetical protein [Sphingobacterium kitahiroshimense]|uniref:Lipoprotein n=1 Tax=Sphingobacterium kitahiroshimense TaxID=470446 RepID=A0ABV0BYJ4_9SPHI